MDGRLNEPAWQQARKISNFTQRELHEGRPATERTDVAVLYDTKNLFVGVWCYDDHPDKIVASQMKRDFNYGTDDNFQIVIDTYGDRRNGYLFITNPNAARADILVSQNGQSNNRDWNGVWNVKTTRTARGWFAEFEIPFSSLRFAKGGTQIWGINFERNIRRKREQDDWQGWSRNSSIRQVSNAGYLVGIKGKGKTSLIELKPYGITGLQMNKDKKPHFTWNVGGDVNYLITPTLKMNLTINTDFAQVESDRMQVNLTRFSLYYPEKREFFLEGKNYFNFGLGHSTQPFYSRRIGLAPDNSIVPIIAGIRVMGKTGNTSVGAMNIETAGKDTLATANYSVVRVKQDVFKESSVGVIAVSKLEPGHQNFVYGADFTYSNSHFKGNKNISFGGALAQSYTSGRKQKTGLASRLFFDYPNDFIEFSAIWDRSGEGFNPEVGFQRRSAYQMFNADFRIKPRPKKIRWLQQLIFKPFDFNYYIDDVTHKMQSFWSEFRPLGFITRSGEYFEFNIQRKAENLTEDFNIYDDIIVPKGEYWFTDWELQFSTYDGRKVYGNFFSNWGGFYNGSRTVLAGSINWQISKHLRFSSNYQQQHVYLPGGNFIVHELGSRIDFAVNPDLFGSMFAQWNNQEQEMLLNFRVNWIPTPGTNLYFVVNQGYDTEQHKFDAKYTTIQVKFVWRFVM
ncbi:MAG TPA: hypothetical protein ENG85_03590 [Bacteroidetes bacterium]|nr:hypothetical protein [Bacteroidota bacterium]